MAMESDAPFLSQEIITNILKRLPVKSLIRFQCVCKHWKNLLKNPSFILDHLHHSRQNPSLLFRRSIDDDPLNLYLLDCEMQICELQDVPLFDPYDYFSHVTIIGGSCNGLLCIEINVYNISSFLLWNPGIRKVIKLPGSVNDSVDDYHSGFGFSPTVNDYKIVRIYTDFKGVVNQVEVYSLRTGSWKQLKIGKLEGIKVFCETVTANGVIYWHGLKVGEEGIDDISVIVSFDIAMEVFTLIPKPALYSDSWANLTVYNSKLAMLCHAKLRNFESLLIDLWVMEEDTGTFGERWNWTKKYTISFSSDMDIYPFSIWRNEIFCLVDETDEEIEGISFLCLLNPSTHELKKFAVGSCCDEFSVISNHVESLVPVDNFVIEGP